MMSKKKYLWTISRIFTVSFPICSPSLVSYSFFYFKPFLRHYLFIPCFWPNRTSYVFYQFLKTWLFTHNDLLTFLFYTFQISSKYCNIYQEKIKAIGKKIITNQPINSWFYVRGNIWLWGDFYFYYFYYWW